jgi:hypothetical protein
MTASRFLLVLLTLWGLAMIVPDVVRVARPLYSLGLFTDGNGVIADVSEPSTRKRPRPRGAQASGWATGWILKRCAAA